MNTIGTDERNFCTLAHLGPLVVWFFTGGVLGFIVPLAVMYWKKDMHPFVREHARQSSNFQLTMLLVAVVLFGFSFLTFGFGLLLALPVLFGLLILEVIVAVRATMASSRGEAYEYPLTIQFLR